MNVNLRDKILTILSGVSLFCFTLLLFGPMKLYFSNVDEFSYSFYSIWYYILLIAVFSIVVISIVLLLLNQKLFEGAIIVFFVLGVLLWIQGNILVWNYGLFNGTEIHWGNYKINEFIDIIVWVLFISVAFLKKPVTTKLIKKVSIILILIQIISISILWFQAPEMPSSQNALSFNDATKYSFSTQKNVIVLVLDTFQSDIFQEIINDKPEYENMFDGFTYFRNAVGAFPSTYPSIPLILTGHYYDNSVPLKQFLENTYTNKSIPATLQQNGYETDLYSIRQAAINYSPNMASREKVGNNHFTDMTNLYKLSMFRYMPSPIKRRIYNEISESMLDFDNKANLDFAKKVVSDSSAANGNNMFKLFHISGAHPPFRLNEKLEYQALPFNRAGYKIQAESAIQVANKLLTTLKKLGIYDNSMVFIVGDHGGGLFGNFGVNKELAGYSDDPKIVKYTKSRVIAAGIPLVLVKSFNSRGQMKTSDAPISASDIPQTIISELGLKAKFPGFSMFSVKEDSERQRRFLWYDWENNWNDKYLPPMTEYMVDGFSWLNQSWQPTNRKYTSKGVQDISLPKYEYGSIIKFGQDGNAEQYQGDGWGESEKGLTWTDGDNASLIIPIKKPESNIVFEANLMPLIFKSLDRQRVNIYNNGQKLGAWVVQNKGTFRVVIPKESIKDSVLKLTFELRDATSPAELKISDDPRKLGIAVESVTISQKDVYQFGSTIQFGKGGNATAFQGEGWNHPEEGFTWTNGNNASLIIPMEQPKHDVVLVSQLFPFTTKNIKFQRVNIFIKEKQVGQWRISSKGEFKIKIPKSFVNEPFLKINFQLPDASSPYLQKISQDQRMLGIAVRSVTLSETK